MITGKPVSSNGGPPPGAGLNQIGSPPGGPGQYPPQMSGPAGQHNMRGYHQGPPQNSLGGHGGPHQQAPTGPTPTLNQLLQSSGGGSSGGGANSSGSASGGGGASGGAGHPRYPPTTGYEHSNSYGVTPHPLKTEQQQQYPPGAGGWPAGPPPPQQSDRLGPPPPQVNNYGHPPPQHMLDQQQAMYRQVRRTFLTYTLYARSFHTRIHFSSLGRALMIFLYPDQIDISRSAALPLLNRN